MNGLNMKIKCLFLLVALAAASCNDDWKDDVSDLQDRVTTLENSVGKLEQAIESGKLITSVTPIAATATTPAGWKIVFSDKTDISVYNGEQGEPGVQGPVGPQGETPYVWINSAGNWAVNMGSKPADSDNAAYELKVDGKSVKAYGSSTRTINKNGYVAFEEYDAVSGQVLNTVVTTIPFDHQNYITSIVETEESVTFTIDQKPYVLAKAAVYPMSISVIRDRDYLIKGGTATFDIVVNPSTSKVYAAEAFEIDYDADYAPTRGIAPDFIHLRDVVPTSVKGRYTVTLEWAESDTEFAKDAAIFIVLNFTDAKGNAAQVTSATPVIMNEQYVSIANKNLVSVKNVSMFTDETYTDMIRLNDYHEGYVDKIEYSYTGSEGPVAIDPLTRYLNQGDKYKFTIHPIAPTNTAVWPADAYMRHTDVTAQVTDYGRAAVPAVDARPELGLPAIPEIPGIDPKTVTTPFCVLIYKVPADGVIYTHDFQDYWIPNRTVEYKPTVALGAEFAKSGYALSDWNFVVKSQTLAKEDAQTELAGNIETDMSGFVAANNYTAAYKLLPTIDAGSYTISLTVTATAKTVRTAGLKQEREFKVLMRFNIVAPTFQININDGHTLIGDSSDTYYTNKLTDVRVDYLLDVESTKNISKESDVTPAAVPLSYEFDLSAPRHGAQGVRFNPYPAITAPTVSDWGSQMFIRKAITVVVKLATGQQIPVEIMCQQPSPFDHATGTIYVQYDRLNLDHVDAAKVSFSGNYNTMILNGINISAGGNFTPKSANSTTLDPTMIRTSGGIVFSEVGTVQCQGGTLPSGLAGKKILSVNPTTGLVKSIDGMTWENPDAVLYQTFRVTYTDIWGNSASKDVNVYVKSNSLPVI